MKLNLLTTCALAAAALSASADLQQTATQFPPLRLGAAETQQSSMQRAPLNTEKTLGTKIFACTQTEVYNHFFNLYTDQPYKLYDLANIIDEGTDEENYPSMYLLNAGTYTPDGYYAYKVRYYTIGITQVDAWLRVDPETGAHEELADLHIPDIYDNWEYIYDLAWDWKGGKLYGLAQNENGTVTSMIGTIDEEDGTFIKKVASLPEYYFTISFDMDGRCWGIRWTHAMNGDGEDIITGASLDRFDSDWNVDKEVTLNVEEQPFKIYYQNSMDFDRTTGMIWWLATDIYGNQKLVSVDPQSGKTVNKGSIGYAQVGVGMHVPFVTADSRTAPARVENLAFTVDPAGANKVTLTWTNPSTKWNRTSLSELKNVLIFRDSYDGTPVGTVDAAGKVGQSMSWTDETATKGVHKYYVVAQAEEGVKGVPADIDAFVGRDVPGPVNNLSVSSTDRKSVHISWTAPTRGDSDGWFDTASMKYKVVRTPGDAVVAEGLTATEFDDVDIPEMRGYRYVVTAVSNDGEGTPAESDLIIAGQNVVPPFSAKFKEKVEAEMFTPVDRNGDGYAFTWDIASCYDHPGEHIYKLMLEGGNNDDLLIAPAMNLKKDAVYRVDFSFGQGGYGYDTRIMHHKFALAGGLDPTANGMDTQLDLIEDYTTDYIYAHPTITMYFTSPVDGEYYVGINVLTQGEADAWYYMRDFSIVEVPAGDLKVDAFRTYPELSNTSENTFDVTVFNNTTSPISGYKVQVGVLDSQNQPMVFGENASTPEIPARSSKVINVRGIPSRQGLADVVGIIEYASDGNPDNNVSEPVRVNISELDAFTTTLNSGTFMREETRLPMNHNYAATASQTIYPTKLFNVTPNGKEMYITRAAWEYTNDKVAFDGTQVQLYIDTTDKKAFDSSEYKFVSMLGTKVFDGEVPVEMGSQYMIIDFDTPVEFDPERNLMVTLSKQEYGHAGEWIQHFNTFDYQWENTAAFRTMLYEGNNAFTTANASDVNGDTFPNAAVLHLAITGLSGVDEIVLTGKGALAYDSTTGTVRLGDSRIARLVAYTTDGRVAMDRRFAGADSAVLEVAPGIYVVNVLGTDGRNVSAKLIVR